MPLTKTEKQKLMNDIKEKILKKKKMGKNININLSNINLRNDNDISIYLNNKVYE